MVDFRVHPLAEPEHPKSSLPVANIPIIEHQLSLLALAGYESEFFPYLITSFKLSA